MRAENSNSNLADILMAHLTYSTENYEEKDAKNNFLVDPKKSDVPTGVHTNSLISLFMILFSSVGLAIVNKFKKREV